MSDCACGHEHDLHTHYTRSTSCAICDCPTYTNAWSRRRFALVWLGILICLAAFWVTIGIGVAHANGPDKAGGGRVRARPCQTLPACHRAIAWQAKDRRHLRRLVAVKFQRDASYAIHLAAATFGVDERQMRSVAWCESRMGAQTTAEAGSGASGLFQFLGSTWAHTPFSTFDVFDPFPNALAAAQIVAHDGGWGQWTCKP